MFGNDLLPLLVLALGAAMCLGNVLALVRPPTQPKPGELTRAPRGRTIAMAVVGGLAMVWALASLVVG